MSALGIGATAAIFSIVNVVLLRPLPFPHAERIYWVTEWLGRLKQEISAGGDYLTLRDNARNLTDLAAYNSGGVTWTGPDGPQFLTAGLVTSSFFPLLGVQPEVGRVFRVEEDRPGSGQVVILSYGLWQRKFGGNPAVVGQTIRLDREPARVIGIMPRGFSFPAEAELWRPLRLNEAQERERKRMLIVEILGRAQPRAYRTARSGRRVASTDADRRTGVSAAVSWQRLHRRHADLRSALAGTPDGKSSAGRCWCSPEQWG